jgi:hypothetical protein
LRIAARWWKVSSRSAGPPVARPYSSAVRMSIPAEEIVVTCSPVTASSSGVPPEAGAVQDPFT